MQDLRSASDAARICLGENLECRIIQIMWADRNSLMMKKNDNIKDGLVTISASIVIFAIVADVMLSMSIDMLEKQLVSIYGVILLLELQLLFTYRRNIFF
jgi:hypothetical protein